ncbi:MAG: adenosylcobinamide-phosphate synthase CbiB [Pseudomonadota bacterium]
MILAFAMILDAIFGEPEKIWQRVPHPAVVMGNAIEILDETLNDGQWRKARGALAVAILVAASWLLGKIIQVVPDFGLLEMLGAAILLAQRSLVDHVRAVAQGLRQGVAEGRAAVAMIVGRDTARLTESGVARAAIESAAENLSDGVVAPAFWFLVGGLPGMLVYKAVNTADSMIGYKTPRYRQFGWAAARLDDVMNWIPARVTALLMIASHLALSLWPRIPNDARQHASPNAGWPEAAIAPLLGLRLGGPRTYGDTQVEGHWINPMGREEARVADVDDTVSILWRTWGACLLLVAVLGLIF